MIDDVLDLSQAGQGRMALRREWVDVSQTIGSALGVVRPLLDKKRLTLQVDIADGIPQVWCDRRRIDR